MTKPKGTFQFNQSPDEVLGRKEAELPERIQGMEVLSDNTKGQLAQMEAQMEQVMGSSAPAPPTPPPTPAAPLEDSLTPIPEPTPKEGHREELERGLVEEEDERYLNFVGEEDQDILNNDALRDAIEARCETLSLGDLIATGRARQRIPIVPDEFEVVMQTTNGLEDLFIKDQLLGVVGSQLAVQQRYADMNLALGLASINGEVGPPAYEGEDLNKDLFDARVMWLRKMPIPVLVSLHTNYAWFERRTRKLFNFRGDQ